MDQSARRRVLALVFVVTALWPFATPVTADPGDPELIATIPVAEDPYFMRLDPVQNRVYVSSGGNGSVSVVDGEANAVVATLPFGSWDVALNPLTSRVYVPDPDAGAIRVVDGETLSLVATILTDANPTMIAAKGMARSLLISTRADGSFSTDRITRRFPLCAPPCFRRDDAAL